MNQEFKKTTQENNSLFMWFVLITPLIVTSYFLLVMMNYKIYREKFMLDIVNVKNNIQKQYQNSNYELVNSSLLKNNQKLMLIDMEILPTTIKDKKDAFAIEIYLGKHPKLSACGVFSSLKDHFEIIKISDEVINKNLINTYKDCINRNILNKKYDSSRFANNDQITLISK